MKRPPEAPRADLGRLTQADLDQINAEVTESVRLAKERAASAAAAARSLSRTAAAARGDQLPASNTGGKYETLIAARLVLEDGEVVEVPARRTWGGSSAFLDWLNFTTDETDFSNDGNTTVFDDQIIDLVSLRCQQIFGFGITEARATGANFYHRSYVLGDGYGMVCHGGQRSTVLIVLSGKGCEAAKEGWERRLYNFLTDCGPRARITRCDLAHDIYDGAAYSVDRANDDFDLELFNCGGRTPDIEHRGNWKRPNGKGRTLYIGHRTNGKYARIYEKGKQLGDKNSPWCRVEVEFKSVSRIIPFEVLLEPGQYLAAAYPAFAWISEHQERILTTQKSATINYASMMAWLKRQCGAALNAALEIEGSAEAMLEKIIKPGACPPRLKIPGWQFAGPSIHERKREALPLDVLLEAQFA